MLTLTNSKSDFINLKTLCYYSNTIENKNNVTIRIKNSTCQEIPLPYIQI